jgi:DNA-binding transcriptional ArsR family regulator
VVGILTTPAEHPATMSSRGGIHLPVDDPDRELAAIFGHTITLTPEPTDRALDEILASRTHVRVLRTLAALDQELNLTARDVARRAGASHGRVMQVLRQLESLGVVTTHWAPTHAVHRLNVEHPLHAALRSLFDAEREL